MTALSDGILLFGKGGVHFGPLEYPVVDLEELQKAQVPGGVVQERLLSRRSLRGFGGGLGGPGGAGDGEHGEEEAGTGIGVVAVIWLRSDRDFTQGVRGGVGEAARTRRWRWGVESVPAGVVKGGVRHRGRHGGGMWGKFRVAGGEELRGRYRGSRGQR